jgi:hypothetical protein
LDIDYARKNAQKLELSNNELLDRAIQQNKDLYIERTVNGGLHILFSCAEPLYIGKAMAKLNLVHKHSGSNHGVVFEFKHRCLTWPSADYKPVGVKPRFAQRHALAQIIATIEKFYRCFESSSFLLRDVDWTQYVQKPATVSQRAAAVDLNALIPRAEFELEDDANEPLCLERRLHKIFVRELNPDMPVEVEAEDGEEPASPVIMCAGAGEGEDGRGRKRKSTTTMVGQECKRLALNVIKHYNERGHKIAEFVSNSYNQDECEPAEYQANFIYR